MGFFSINSPLYKFMDRLWDLVKLNFFWLICSVPIITIGAATTAAFSVALKMSDEQEGYIGKEFFKSFKANLKQGIALGIISIVAIYSVYMDFQFYQAYEGNPLIFLIIGIFSLFIVTFALLYSFPLLARYENSVLNTLKNSFEISIQNIPRTLFLTVLVIIEVILISWNLITIFIGFLIGPACIFLTISAFSMYLFRKIEKEQ